MTNHHTKLKNPWAFSSLVIDQTRFVYGRTDGQQMDTMTNMYKAINPLFFEGGHNKTRGTANMGKAHIFLIYLQKSLFLGIGHFKGQIWIT